jgi:hypothetical protein
MLVTSIVLNLVLLVYLIHYLDKYHYYKHLWEKGRPETYGDLVPDIDWETGDPEEEMKDKEPEPVYNLDGTRHVHYLD